jgi:hypothetical protein
VSLWFSLCFDLQVSLLFMCLFSGLWFCACCITLLCLMLSCDYFSSIVAALKTPNFKLKSASTCVVVVYTGLGSVPLIICKSGNLFFGIMLWLNRIKYDRMKYDNGCLFHNVEKVFLAQPGDPSGTVSRGDSAYKLLVYLFTNLMLFFVFLSSVK